MTQTRTAYGKRAKVARVEALLPDPRVHWLEETYHDVPLQRPRELAAVIESFLTDRPGPVESTATKINPWLNLRRLTR